MATFISCYEEDPPATVSPPFTIAEVARLLGTPRVGEVAGAEDSKGGLWWFLTGSAHPDNFRATIWFPCDDQLEAILFGGPVLYMSREEIEQFRSKPPGLEPAPVLKGSAHRGPTHPRRR